MINYIDTNTGMNFTLEELVERYELDIEEGFIPPTELFGNWLVNLERNGVEQI